MSYDVLVIGGGVNGLTTAAYLAKAGKRVLVAERRATLGGLCVTEEFSPGFRANSCVDDPGWMPDRVIKDLGLATHGYAATFAPHSMTIPIDGGAPIVITPDVRATAGSILPHSVRDANKWPEFCAFVARLSGFIEATYSVRAPAVESNAPGDLLTLLSLGKKMRGLGKRGMIDVIRTIPMPIADLLDEWFEHDGLKGALSTLGVTNVQHGPQSGGTALVFLHNHVGMPLGCIGGRRVVRGGVGTLVSALASAVTRAGGTIRTDAEVSRVRVKEDRVAGVVLGSGEEIAVSTVVSSADPRRSFTSLLDAGDLDPEFLHAVDCIRMRGPQVRVHLALDSLPRGASASTVVAPTMSYVEQAYDAAKHGRIAERPWLRMSVPTLEDASLAPNGKHVMSIHAQYAAYKLRDGWDAARRGVLGESIVRLAVQQLPGLSGAILHTDVLTPPCIEERYGATEGSLLHGELTLDQFLFARPVASNSRYASPVDGLWLCGSGTHPGAGTAGASGRLAAKEILG
jgi:phytoene dehydrogenase-like protein